MTNHIPLKCSWIRSEPIDLRPLIGCQMFRTSEKLQAVQSKVAAALTAVPLTLFSFFLVPARQI